MHGGESARNQNHLRGGAALSLWLNLVNGKSKFYRDNQLPVLPDILIQRESFPICGKLIGNCCRVVAGGMQLCYDTGSGGSMGRPCWR